MIYRTYKIASSGELKIDCRKAARSAASGTMQVNSQDFDSRSARIRFANGAGKKSHTLHASMIVFSFFTPPYPDESGLIAPIGESEIRRRPQRTL